jgi:hypothetical protein
MQMVVARISNRCGNAAFKLVATSSKDCEERQSFAGETSCSFFEQPRRLFAWFS